MTAPNTPTPPPPAAPPPELAPALALFERGNFRDAHAAIKTLLNANPTPEIEATAKTLQARMAPDPWALRAGVLALAILIAISVRYLHL